MSFRIDDILKKDDRVKTKIRPANLNLDLDETKFSKYQFPSGMNSAEIPNTPNSTGCERQQHSPLNLNLNELYNKNPHQYNPVAAAKRCYSSDDCFVASSPASASSTDSILLQTLTNRNQQNVQHPYFGRSLSVEQYSKMYSSASGWHDRDLRTNSTYCDLYAQQQKALAYSNMYIRSRLWTPYSPTGLPMFLPHYSYYSKRKGGQVRFTASQTDALEKRFVSHKYLSPEDRRILAESLELSDRQASFIKHVLVQCSQSNLISLDQIMTLQEVKTWFQNRRAKWRRSNSSSSNTDSEIQVDKLDSSESEEEPTPSIIIKPLPT